MKAQQGGTTIINQTDASQVSTNTSSSAVPAPIKDTTAARWYITRASYVRLWLMVIRCPLNFSSSVQSSTVLFGS